MSITSGFFNSVNGDRKYYSDQMSQIFDGIINDGVFMNIGKAFEVLATTGNVVTLGIGKCWFNSSWLLNDALYPIDLEESEVLLDRIDAIVVEVNRDMNTRKGHIIVIKGIPASNPQKPTMIESQYVNQHPLAYVRRIAGKSTTTQSDITMAVGTNECPYITGILKTANIDSLLLQWKSQWNDWTDDQKIEFQNWFESLNTILDGDIATNLARQIYRIEHVTKVTLRANDWIGTEAPFTQTVVVPEANESSSAMLVRAMSEDATFQEQAAYARAFTFISSGTAKLGVNAFDFTNYGSNSAWAIGNYIDNGNVDSDSKYVRYENAISVGSNQKFKMNLSTYEETEETPINIKCDIVIFDALNVYSRRITYDIDGGLYIPEESDDHFYLVLYDGDELVSGPAIMTRLSNGFITIEVGTAIGSATFKVYKKPETNITVGLKGIGTSDFYRSTSIILDAKGHIIQD